MDNKEIYFDFSVYYPDDTKSEISFVKKQKDMNFDTVFEMCNNFANLCGYDLKEYKKHE